jgi:hypothetical protein
MALLRATTLIFVTGGKLICERIWPFQGLCRQEVGSEKPVECEPLTFA